MVTEWSVKYQEAIKERDEARGAAREVYRIIKSQRLPWTCELLVRDYPWLEGGDSG